MKAWAEIKHERPGFWRIVAAILVTASAFVISLGFIWDFVRGCNHRGCQQ